MEEENKVMEEENKVIIKLKKQPLASEREEIRERRLVIAVTFAIAVLFTLGAFLAGYFVSGATNNYYYETDSSKFSKIKEIMENNWLYSSEYEDLDTVLDDNAYYGMTSFADDPYTTYMSSEDLESFTSGINMDYVGIGVQYLTTYEVPEIIRVFHDSPAEKAGLEVGDVIKKVDDIEVTDENIGDLRDYVLGEEGTTVTITVDRGGELMSFDVIRGAVDSTVYAYEGDGYDYLEIISFGDGTATEVEKYLKEFTSDKLIIDLRDDSGGYQTAVQAIAGLFIGPGKVYMRQVGVDGEEYNDMTSGLTEQYTFDKIIVLVNENTASAAEVLTICLKEQLDNVTIVGTTTFGKGVVQSTFMVENDSALKVTTSKWLSPVNGIWINGEGIEPDVEVKLHDIFYTTVSSMEEDAEYGYDSCDGCVRIAELSLDYLGYNPERTDGYFSSRAIESLKQFKKDYGLENEEVLDYATYRKLIQEVQHDGAVNTANDYQLNKAIELLED